jgi:uncharacterized protein (TIGR02145 family)
MLFFLLAFFTQRASRSPLKGLGGWVVAADSRWITTASPADALYLNQSRLVNNLGHIVIICFILTTAVFPVINQSQNEGTFTDARDGHVYKWVKIGNQIWMTENLAYLPQVNREDDSLFNGKCFYVYGYDGEIISEAKSKETFKKYGVLYNWDAAREGCPQGWHLPTDEEWRELEEYLGMAAEELGSREWRSSGEVGKKLKSVLSWKMNNGSNEFNFNILPGGCRGYGGFGSLNFCAYFWTASAAGNDNAWRRGFCGDDSGSCREEDRRYFGLSIRCVKDTQ